MLSLEKLFVLEYCCLLASKFLNHDTQWIPNVWCGEFGDVNLDYSLIDGSVTIFLIQVITLPDSGNEITRKQTRMHGFFLYVELIKGFKVDNKGKNLSFSTVINSSERTKRNFT